MSEQKSNIVQLALREEVANTSTRSEERARGTQVARDCMAILEAPLSHVSLFMAIKVATNRSMRVCIMQLNNIYETGHPPTCMTFVDQLCANARFLARECRWNPCTIFASTASIIRPDATFFPFGIWTPGAGRFFMPLPINEIDSRTHAALVRIHEGYMAREIVPDFSSTRAWNLPDNPVVSAAFETHRRVFAVSYAWNLISSRARDVAVFIVEILSRELPELETEFRDLLEKGPDEVFAREETAALERMLPMLDGFRNILFQREEIQRRLNYYAGPAKHSRVKRKLLAKNGN